MGIDTGGTYTDGVLLEYYSRRVLATAKSLTTKRDFSVGIERVIEGIHIEDPSAIKMVSISTTLATNAIAGMDIRPSMLYGQWIDMAKTAPSPAPDATPIR